LATFPVVVVTGARQTGKSTLAQELGGTDRLYLTLDELSILDQAERAPDQLLTRGPRLTLDEVQRAPSLLLAIKRAVDAKRVPGQFLLTGSANLELLSGVSETLAGRAVYVNLWPMTQSEVAGRGSAGNWDTFLDQPAEGWAPSLQSAEGQTSVSWTDLALRGGYPDPALNLRTADDRSAWFEGYLRTYIERDLQQLASIDNLVGFQRLTRAAALRVGNLMNQADLARDVGLPPTTAQRYLHLLEASYQLLRVESYAVNRTKRLVKSPKLYWNDTGLALHLSAEREPRGAHLENLIVSDLFTWRETRTHRPNILFWRTSKGAEVDLVIETPRGVLPMEVKSSPSVRTDDARHLITFLDEYPDKASTGVLIYGGKDTYWLTEQVLAVPWSRVLTGSRRNRAGS
jgi:predicted AAA+ superfamily ATPase